jgi:hypothetical protein
MLRDVARRLEDAGELAGAVLGAQLHDALQVRDAARVAALLARVRWGVPRPRAELVCMDDEEKAK